eukprot:CAMPEP_0119130702 /NCGR_PEP_ID=MMETSP1310-20130426/8486_1 /TAXON_ID=464262 /ORGANISM="Genus nov. species nov., Strain RCC2339" /LENGTH=60 /DNA_ID=CAMNT_0007121229 /DNA_START=94 /DNA_END=272 /DNA_ORIENTATION=+
MTCCMGTKLPESMWARLYSPRNFTVRWATSDGARYLDTIPGMSFTFAAASLVAMAPQTLG